jgi:hypothetical protein
MTHTAAVIALTAAASLLGVEEVTVVIATASGRRVIVTAPRASGGSDTGMPVAAWRRVQSDGIKAGAAVTTTVEDPVAAVVALLRGRGRAARVGSDGAVVAAVPAAAAAVAARHQPLAVIRSSGVVTVIVVEVEVEVVPRGAVVAAAVEAAAVAADRLAKQSPSSRA